MYGPTSKQLNKVKINWNTEEKPDPQGWYEYAKWEKIKSLPCDTKGFKLQINIDAYLKGHNE